MTSLVSPRGVIFVIRTSASGSSPYVTTLRPSRPATRRAISAAPSWPWATTSVPPGTTLETKVSKDS